MATPLTLSQFQWDGNRIMYSDVMNLSGMLPVAAYTCLVLCYDWLLELTSCYLSTCLVEGERISLWPWFWGVADLYYSSYHLYDAIQCGLTSGGVNRNLLNLATFLAPQLFCVYF